MKKLDERFSSSTNICMPDVCYICLTTDGQATLTCGKECTDEINYAVLCIHAKKLNISTISQ